MLLAPTHLIERAESLLDQPGAYNDYIALTERHRHQLRAFLDKHDPTPEFCAHCDTWTSRDDYLASHLHA